MPVIALAPLFIVTLGRERTPVAIAALAAGFAMFVAATAAVESARAVQHDVFTRARRVADAPVPQSAAPGRDPRLCRRASASQHRPQSSGPCSGSGSARRAASAC